MKLFGKILIALAFLMPFNVVAQNVANPVVDYTSPKTYTLKGIKVEGTSYLSGDRIIALTGLKAGDRIEIPGENLQEIMKRIWLQRKFSDVGFYVDSLSPKGDSCLLVLKLQERPRVSRWEYEGVKNSEKSDLAERLKLRRGGELSDYVEKSSIDIIKNYFKEKGFHNVDAYLTHEPDSTVKNAVKGNDSVTVRGDAEVNILDAKDAIKQTNNIRHRIFVLFIIYPVKK